MWPHLRVLGRCWLVQYLLCGGGKLRCSLALELLQCLQLHMASLSSRPPPERYPLVDRQERRRLLSYMQVQPSMLFLLQWRSPLL